MPGDHTVCCREALHARRSRIYPAKGKRESSRRSRPFVSRDRNTRAEVIAHHAPGTMVRQDKIASPTLDDLVLMIAEPERARDIDQRFTFAYGAHVYSENHAGSV
jgi:hypothetical protein